MVRINLGHLGIFSVGQNLEKCPPQAGNKSMPQNDTLATEAGVARAWGLVRGRKMLQPLCQGSG